MAEQVLGGRYRIVRHLARGGMAEVYLAQDQLLDRPVALKVLFPELARDESFVERFRREAQSAARLNHPNIVSVYDFGEDTPPGEDHISYFIVMEYVAGPTLRDLILAEGPMATDRAVEIAVEIAAGLAAAHDEGIVHRDMKPANVLIAAGVAKVADFGIARASDAAADLTMPGAVVGTASYLSPEQARGSNVDQRSDVYSLGMVLYEMLTGDRPFRGDSPVSVAYKQEHETPPSPSAVNPAVAPGLDAIVGRAMSFDPAHRYGSAEAVRAALLAIGQGPAGGEPTVAMGATPTQVLAAAASPGPAASPRAAGAVSGAVLRRRRMVIAGIVVLLAVVGVVFILSTGGGNATATVPPVVGLRVVDARAALDHAGLKALVVPESRPGVPDQVLEERPGAGSRVNRGTTVSLVVSGTTTTTRAPSASTTRPTTKVTATTLPTTTATAPTTTANAAPTTSAVVTTAPPVVTTSVP